MLLILASARPDYFTHGWHTSQRILGWCRGEFIFSVTITIYIVTINYHLLKSRPTAVIPVQARIKSVQPWLSNVLGLAEIDTPGGSTRSVSATWALARAVPIATTMASADWSSVNTMTRHYIKLLPHGPLATEHLSVQMGYCEIIDLSNQ